MSRQKVKGVETVAIQDPDFSSQEYDMMSPRTVISSSSVTSANCTVPIRVTSSQPMVSKEDSTLDWLGKAQSILEKTIPSSHKPSLNLACFDWEDKTHFHDGDEVDFEGKSFFFVGDYTRVS